MSATYEPGTVAMVTADNRSTPYRAFFDGKTWRDCEFASYCVDTPTGLHPLVVIDPEDREQVERLAELVAKSGSHRGRLSREDEIDGFRDALRKFANPKPAEPTGLGAVVEDAEGKRWVRTDLEGPAWSEWGHAIGRWHWTRINAVRVLSQGVTA